jgi:hypothetical protein
LHRILKQPPGETITFTCPILEQDNNSGFLIKGKRKDTQTQITLLSHELLEKTTATSSSVAVVTIYAGKTALILKQGRNLLQGYALLPAFTY